MHSSFPVIGVLELQGDFAEHTAMLRRCGVHTKSVRLPQDLRGIDGLVIPGGESTTIAKLLSDLHILPPLLHLARTFSLPVFGTCAGAILLSACVLPDSANAPVRGLQLLNATIHRNSYGPQIASFEAHVRASDALFANAPLRAVLIRAPRFTDLSPEVQVLASWTDKSQSPHTDHALLVRQANCLAATFHPELTNDTRVHQYFIQIVNQFRDSEEYRRMTEFMQKEDSTDAQPVKAFGQLRIPQQNDRATA